MIKIALVGLGWGSGGLEKRTFSLMNFLNKLDNVECDLLIYNKNSREYKRQKYSGEEELLSWRKEPHRSKLNKYDKVFFMSIFYRDSEEVRNSLFDEVKGDIYLSLNSPRQSDIINKEESFRSLANRPNFKGIISSQEWSDIFEEFDFDFTEVTTLYSRQSGNDVINSKEDDHVACIPTRLVSSKNSLEVFRSFKHLDTENRKFLFGGDLYGPYSIWFKKDPSWEDDNVIIRGGFNSEDIDDMKEVYAPFKFMIDFSDFGEDVKGATNNGIQHTTLEAMDYGCVPIMLKGWGTVLGKEVLVDGENCFLMDKEKLSDEESLAEFLEKCFSLPDDEWEEMVKNNFDLIDEIEEFTHKEVFKRYLKALEIDEE